MKISLQSRSSGIALIVVMLVMIMLGALAGLFAYSMKVEVALARKAVYEPELEWTGRSGVELARYLVGREPEQRYHALNQRWAGGWYPEMWMEHIPVDNVRLGRNSLAIKTIDLDRKFNVNVADKIILEGALELVGIDPTLIPTIVDSIQDWRDRDDNNRLSGAETTDYLGNPNPGFAPYIAKNRPFDDISELLYVRGVTHAMYWGSSGGGRGGRLPRSRQLNQSRFEEPVYFTGLVNLFTPLSSRLVNINTASAIGLQVVPQIDENIAAAIIMARAGPDGSEGDDEDTPFQAPQEIATRVPGFNPELAQQVSQYLTVRSQVFEVHVRAQAGGEKREYIAVFALNVGGKAPDDPAIISFYWR